MITNMIVLLCLSVFPMLMGTSVVKSDVEDCSDINGIYRASGVYTMSIQNEPVKVYCEMVYGGQNDRGNWMVILRRMNGDVNFNRSWRSYKLGFGNTGGEYWLGLEFLHQLTLEHQYILRVDVEDFQGRKAYALFKSFYVSSEANGYKLQVSGFVNGGAGDSLSYHNGMKFSTFDKDQDPSGKNCAKTYKGGFWFNDCVHTNPTGDYLGNKVGTASNPGVTWYYWKNSWDPLKSITMKIRRVK